MLRYNGNVDFMLAVLSQSTNRVKRIRNRLLIQNVERLRTSLLENRTKVGLALPTGPSPPDAASQ